MSLLDKIFITIILTALALGIVGCCNDWIRFTEYCMYVLGITLFIWVIRSIWFGSPSKSKNN